MGMSPTEKATLLAKIRTLESRIDMVVLRLSKVDNIIASLQAPPAAKETPKKGKK